VPDRLKTQLKVNNSPIDLNEFSHEFITRIVICAVAMLKGGTEVKSLIFSLEGDKVSLIVNEKTVPLSAFPRDALIGTFSGMVSSLKGVDRLNRANNIQIQIKSN
jgi:hypothetical protein